MKPTKSEETPIVQAEPDRPAAAGQGYVKLVAARDLPSGAIGRYTVGRRAIALAHADGEFFAFEDRCLHWGVRLSDGSLEGRVVRCRAHGWRHDVARGEVVASDPPGDEGRRFARFETRLEDGHVWVRVPV